MKKYPKIKRFLDFWLSFSFILLIFPIFFLIAIVNLIIYKGDIFYFQSRPGLNGKLFKIIKFKSMTNAKDSCGLLLPDGDRLNKWGSFLRSTSLDEIPELFNVLLGDMSLVGPRPLLEEYLPLYNEKQRMRHNIRPGITGLAQVMGRNELEWEEKFELDVLYVQNVSFILDCKIFLMTFFKVFAREGINTPGVATARKFKGFLDK